MKARSPAVLIGVLVLLSYHAMGQSQVADSLKRIVARNEKDSSHFRALSLLASEYARTDMERAKSYAFTIIRLADEVRTNHCLTSAYSHLITINQNMGHPDSARYYFGKLEKVAKENPDNLEIQTNYNHTAGLYYKNLGDYRRALPFQLKGYEYASRMDPNGAGPAGYLLNIGNTYHNMGEIRKAADYHIKALRKFEEIGNLRGQSFCLQSLGNDFKELKVYGTAEEYFSRSLKMKEQLNDSRGIVTACFSLGVVARVQKDFPKALKYLNLAADRARELKWNVEEAKALFEISRIESETGNRESAKRYLNESFEKAKATSDSAIIMLISAERSQIQREESNFLLTEKTFQSKLQIAGRSGNKPGVADSYKDMANLYASNGQFREAFGFLNKYILLNDSIRGSEIVGQLKTIEQAYEREKNEKEIALLKKDQELKEATIAKQKSDQYMIAIAFVSILFIAGILFNRYKAVSKVQRQVEIEKVRNHIARDLHDDIGSTLSSINLISKLALQDNTDVQRQLQRIAENSSRMMESMSDIVWSINPTHDSFGQVIVKMKEFAGEILEPKNITYSIVGEEEVSDIPVDIEKRKNLFLIFKEAINNTAKYSGATHVDVSFKKENEDVFFEIADNGRGFDPTRVRLGNGLKNMEARARSFNGSLSLGRTNGTESGTRIAVKFAIT